LVTTSKHEMTEREIDALMTFATQAGIANANARLLSKLETSVRKLKKYEEEYKQLVEDINDGYLVTQDGKIIFANRRCAELFGYKLEEVLGRPFEDFVPLHLYKSLVDQYERGLRGEVVPEQYEWELVKKDGTIAPVEFTANLTQYQGRPAVCALITDPPKRKGVEEELKRARQELEATQRELLALQKTTASIQTTLELDQILQQIAHGIVEGTVYDGSAIFLLDKDKNIFRLIIVAPPKLLAGIEKILGYKASEFTIPSSEAIRKIQDGQVIITHDLYEVAALRLSRVICSAIQRLMEAKTILGVPMIAKEKVIGAFLVTTRLEEISERGIESLVSFANQAASMAENARLLDIEKKEQQRTALLMAIVHEFKTPLTSIKTAGSLLAEELKDAQSPQAKLVDNIRRSVNKMEERLADLLDFARVQTGMVELQLQPTNIKSAIEEAVSLCSPLILSKRQTLEVAIPDSLPWARLDQLRFERIITNLLTNASKFTPENGKIEVKARMEDDSLLVEVKDSGVGIAEDEQERIFEPYYRGKASSGLGLGLAIVKQLVELHRDRVWVESKLGKGSTFIFSLPLKGKQ